MPSNWSMPILSFGGLAVGKIGWVLPRIPLHSSIIVVVPGTCRSMLPDPLGGSANGTRPLVCLVETEDALFFVFHSFLLWVSALLTRHGTFIIVLSIQFVLLVSALLTRGMGGTGRRPGGRTLGRKRRISPGLSRSPPAAPAALAAATAATEVCTLCLFCLMSYTTFIVAVIAVFVVRGGPANNFKRL